MDNMGSFSQAQWPTWAYNTTTAYPISGYTQLSSYAAYLPESMDIYSAHQRHLVHHQMSRTTESKPRLSKEEVEVLEAEFQKNHKPNSSTKKALAESMRVDNARINNWFQNRRAREKKERNIREYAAKQQVEKDQVSVEADSPPNHRHKDLVASSAPFPTVRRPSKALTEASELPSTLTTPGPESETTDVSQCDDLAVFSSPEASVHGTPADPLTFRNVCSVKLEYSSPQHDDDDLKDGFISDHSSDFLSLVEHGQREHGDGLSVPNTAPLSSLSGKPFFSQYPQLIIHDEEGEATPSFSACFNENTPLPDSNTHYHQGDLSTSAMPQLVSPSPDMALKSPPSIDIASRRNRRPPHLAINASRSYSSVFPRTGMEMGRRSDSCSSMRRVASATGPIRISKNCSTPRSPFFDRHSEVLFQLNRSPGFVESTGSVAPPTPNTPAVSNYSGMGEFLTTGIDEKYPPMLAVHERTLKTPPTTPGILDTMFNMDSAYEVPVSDEALNTPGLGTYSQEFEMPGMNNNNVPNYISSSSSSQPQTPSCLSHMGPTYFGYSGGNAEYNWSDASLSANSSPSQSQRQVQFMNMTPSSFAQVER